MSLCGTSPPYTHTFYLEILDNQNQMVLDGRTDNSRKLVSLKISHSHAKLNGCIHIFWKCVLTHMSVHALTLNTLSTVSIIIIIISHFPPLPVIIRHDDDCMVESSTPLPNCSSTVMVHLELRSISKKTASTFLLCQG